MCTHGQTGQKYVETHEAAIGSYRERVLAEIDYTADELACWKGMRAAQLADGAATAYSREVLAVGDLARYVGHHPPDAESRYEAGDHRLDRARFVDRSRPLQRDPRVA